jgi:hypothetical protein
MLPSWSWEVTKFANNNNNNNNNNTVNRLLYIRFTHRKKSLYIKAHFSLKSTYLFLKNSGYHERGELFHLTTLSVTKARAWVNEIRGCSFSGIILILANGNTHIKLLLIPLRPPQILNGLAHYRTQVSAVKARQLTAWVTARPWASSKMKIRSLCKITL